MPSASLLRWQNERIPRLTDIERQCASSLALAPPQPNLVEENLRGYVLLLSAHFQGFCRDLHTECVQVIASKVRSRLQLLIQDQFSRHRALDHGNPNLKNVRQDFERFGIDLSALLAAVPANAVRLQHLATLNQWRNVAAHQSAPTIAAGPLSLPLLQAWRASCDGLAASMDQIMYNELRRMLRRAPW